MKAAVCYDFKKPLVIEDIDIDGQARRYDNLDTDDKKWEEQNGGVKNL